MKKKIHLLLVLFLISLALSAQSKPEITVIVNLNEYTFRQRYPNNILDTENLLAQKIAAYLNSQIPVFMFKASGSSLDTLHVRFAQTGNKALYDVNFLLYMSGRSLVENIDSMKLELVKNVRFSTIFKDSYLDFVEVVMFKFRNVLKSEEFISKQIKHLLIRKAVSGPPDFTNKEWTLLFTHKEVSLFFPSQFVVRQTTRPNSTLQVFMAQVRSSKLNSRIILKAIDGGDDTNELKSQVFERIEGIQLLKANSKATEPTLAPTLKP